MGISQMSRVMQDPLSPKKPENDLTSLVTACAFALAFGTIAMVVVGTLPHVPW
jgi:hypothetical protein